ncbi:MAG: G8 domain-containing protein [Cyanobacteria bacterium J06626_6]
MDHASVDSKNMMSHHNSPHSATQDPKRHKDHSALQNLIDATQATHTAIRSGAWSNPRTWQNGKVPGSNAKVLIGEGTTVTYDQESNTRIQTVVIEGNLRFSTDRNTKLFVETILNGPEGKLEIGSSAQAVAADNQAQIIFTSDRALNTQWDPTQLSKGLISHGEVNIYGARKLGKAALAGDALAGSNVLKFKQPLSGWRVGDRIVLGGTSYRYGAQDTDNSRFRDEVLTITAIDGNEVRFVNEDIPSGDNTVLRYDHVRSTLANPDDLTLYAGNLSRNVSFETENGADVPISRRAHVMLMHNPKVNVLNAGFYHLGRSDKSKLVDDVGTNVDGTPGKGKNQRGRYSLHLHRTGAEDLNGPAAIVKGNAVEGSPGWGIVQHDSRAGLEDNVVFDTVGAGIAAESGNETGWWTNNLVIKTTGISHQQANQERKAREKKFDFGNEGVGYWIQASQIKNANNTAISSNKTGMELFSGVLDTANTFRDVKTIKVSNLPPDLQKLFPAGQTEVDIRDIPLADVTGFESYNANMGLRVWGRQTNFDGELDFSTKEPETAHEGRSSIKDFKLWGNLYSGALIQYSSNVDLENGLILGRDTAAVSSNGAGLLHNDATFGSKHKNLSVAGFNEGVRIEYPNNNKAAIASSITGSSFFKNNYNLNKVGDEAARNERPDDFGAFLKLNNNRFTPDKNNKAPVAKFNTKALGGLAVALDASASQDPDPLKKEDGTPRKLASKGIAAYGWDLNNNGTIDRYGRTLTHIFNKAGSQTVALTVIDSQGQATTLQQTINVQNSDYINAFSNGSFSSNTPTQANWQNNSQWADKGWFLNKDARLTGEHARISKPGAYGGYIGQVTQNNKVHRGQQTLRFKLKNLEGAPKLNSWEDNQMTITLWGINGQFKNSDAYNMAGPEQVGTLPMQSKKLTQKTYGTKENGTFDWKNFSLDVNLGKGYDYLLFQINTKSTHNSGDYVAIDDVFLKGPASTQTPQSTAQGNLEPEPKKAALEDPKDPTPPDPTNTPTKQPMASPGFPAGLAPVARLSFDEGTGQLAVDTSNKSKNNSGRLRGNAGWDDGKFGQAVTFNGQKDLVTLQKSSDINLGTHNQRTISVWFNTDDVLNNNKQVIYEEGGRVRGLNMYIEDDLLYFGGWSTPNRQWMGSWISTDKIEAGKWHHAALVLDGTGRLQENALTAYLDGEKVGSAAGTKLWAHRDDIGIGNINGTARFHDDLIGRKGLGLVGSIDEVQIYNDALSASQVQQLAGGL